MLRVSGGARGDAIVASTRRRGVVSPAVSLHTCACCLPTVLRPPLRSIFMCSPRPAYDAFVPRVCLYDVACACHLCESSTVSVCHLCLSPSHSLFPSLSVLVPLYLFLPYVLLCSPVTSRFRSLSCRASCHVSSLPYPSLRCVSTLSRYYAPLVVL